LLEDLIETVELRLKFSQAEATDQEVGYVPLPLLQRITMRVRVKLVGDFGPIPDPIEPDDPEQE
jgi:hypothetical protein